MTLSFARAVKHGGLMETSISVTTSDADVVAHSFLISGSYVATVAGLKYAGDSGEDIADLSGIASRDGQATLMVPVLISDPSGDWMMFSAMAEAKSDGVNLRIAKSTMSEWVGLFDSIGARGDIREVLLEADRSLRDSIGAPRQSDSTSSIATRLRAFNRSMLEGFVWSEMVSYLRRDHGAESISTLFVSPSIIVDDPLAPGPAGLPDMKAEYEPNETPGTPFREMLRVEYNDARSMRSRSGLTLRDVCGRSQSTTCLGGDSACDYDDYVFARATGRCRSCATQDSVRSKFTIDD